MYNHKPSLSGGKHELQFEKKPSFSAEELYDVDEAGEEVEQYYEGEEETEELR